ncbi:Lipid II flippase FtsW [compost metagenome]
MDLSLLVVVLALAVCGLLTILSASAPTAQQEMHNSLFFFQRQAVWMVLGVFALALGSIINLGFMRRMAKWILLGTACMLIATHIPGIGVTELGASRWIRLGPISVQPSELAKLAVSLYAADLLARYGAEGWNINQFRQVVLPIGGTLGLVLLQPDLGTTLVLATAAFVLFFCNGTRIWTMAAIAGAGISFVLYHSWNTPYMRLRWLGFMDPWGDAQGKGFQLVQSLMAIGSGGVFGEGWGQGKQKLFWLPIQYTDFIFAVFAEEMGLIGSLVIIVLFLALAWRGFAIAGQAREPFHALLAIALTTIVVVQALINIGVVTASLPTTGIPLPFLSFGGTSLLATLFSMGLVLNISRQAQKHAGAIEKRPAAAQPDA